MDAKKNQALFQMEDRKGEYLVRWFLILLILIVLAVLVWHGFSNQSEERHRIIVYAFSSQEEVLTQGIFPAFERLWKEETGEKLTIEGKFGPSGTLSLQITKGQPADVAIFSNQRHIDWLKYSKCVGMETNQVMIATSPVVIVTRSDNPRNIIDFSSLAQPGLVLLHGNPGSSGVGEWSLMAEYGSMYIETGDQNLAEDQVIEIWQNVRLVGSSARTTMTLFELGAGDALVTYEQEAYFARQRDVPLEIIMPQNTLQAGYYAVAVDKNVTPVERPVVESFLTFLQSREGQQILAEYYFRPVLYDSELLPKMNDVFTEDELDNWSLVYDHLVVHYWRTEVEPDLEMDPMFSFLVIRD